MGTKQTIKRTTVKTRVHRHIKLALIPHKVNQFRPHVLRRYGIVAIIVAVVGLQAVYNGVTSGNVLGTEAQITPTTLLDATNQARVQQGLSPLALNSKLDAAAELKVKNMFADQYWAHNAPDGTSPWHWFNEAGYSYAEAGENLAKNFTNSHSVISAWLASPTHRANVLKGDYKDVGFASMEGVLDGKRTTLVVAMYATPEGAAVVQGVGAAPGVSTPLFQGAITPVTRLSLGMQSLTPAAVASIIVLVFAALLAIVAHLYRKNLPPHLRRSWYRHHGVYKAIGFTSLAFIIVLTYGSVGQI